GPTLDRAARGADADRRAPRRLPPHRRRAGTPADADPGPPGRRRPPHGTPARKRPAAGRTARWARPAAEIGITPLPSFSRSGEEREQLAQEQLQTLLPHRADDR